MSRKDRPWIETELRHQGMRLLKSCWLPVLAVALICLLLDVLTSVGAQHCEQRAIASVAHLVPGPEPELYTEDWFYYQVVDVTLYESELDMAKAKWALAALPVEIAAGLLEVVLLLGLFRGLLRTVRGGTCCTLHEAFSGFHKGGWRAVKLNILVGLVVAGVYLVGMIVMNLLDNIPVIGGLVGGIGLIVALVWFSFRYTLAPLYLADEENFELSVTDCMRGSGEDMKSYGVLGLIVTLWPMLLMSLVASQVESHLGGAWVPVVLALEAVAQACIWPCLATIYQDLRTGKTDPATPEGRERARALMREDA